MRYFSRVVLDPANVNTSELIRLLETDSYREHQFIWRLFTEDPDADRDFLFRREQSNRCLFYYVVSKRQPRNHSSLWQIDFKRYEPKIHAGQKLAFSLRVNPIVTKKDASNRHVRHDVIMDAKKRIGFKKLPPSERPSLAELIQEAGTAWLKSRSEKHGFEINEELARAEGYKQHRFFKGENKHLIRFSTLDLTGILTVVDPELFRNTLFNGIGPAKSFGCGMMMVRRV